MRKKKKILSLLMAACISLQANSIVWAASPEISSKVTEQKTAEQILQYRLDKNSNSKQELSNQNNITVKEDKTNEKTDEKADAGKIQKNDAEEPLYTYQPPQYVLDQQTQATQAEQQKDKNEPLYSFDWKGTSLSQSLYAISKLAHVKLILNGDLKGTVYATLSDITYSDALNYLSNAFGFNWMQVDDTIIVSTGEAMPQTQSFSVRYVNIDKIKSELKTLGIDDDHVYANSETNSVTISGTSYQLVQAARLIKSLDHPVSQVLVVAQLIELSHGKDLDLGFSYGLPTYEHAAKDTTSSSSGNSSSDFSGNWLEKMTFSASATAAKTLSKGKVISRPMLLAKNGQEASVFMGAEVPIPTNTYNNGSNDITFNYQQVGSSITVTPTVDMLTGEINMKLDAEIKNISRYVTSGNLSVPEISSRTAKTEVRLRSGQSFCIGGLMTTQDINNLSGIPGLMDIPILGELFKHRVKSKENTEVFLLITPYIVTDGINPEQILRQQGQYRDTGSLIDGHTYKDIGQ